jgi:TonB-dependent receptor
MNHPYQFGSHAPIRRGNLPFSLAIDAALLLLFLVSPLETQAQSTGALAGQVVDETGEPLPGTNVSLEELQRGVAANENGRYRLSNVPTGEQTLVVSFIGYETATRTVTIRADRTTTQDVQLSGSAVQAQELIVEGQRGTIRTNQTKEASPAIVDALDLQTLERYPDQTLAESLDRLPGVFTQANLGQGITGTAGRGFKNSFIVVRGIQPDLNSTTVLGQSLVSTTGDRAVALDVLPANVASQVEVVKSPTADLSANGIGGTTNIVPLSAFSQQGAFLSASAEGAFRDEVGTLAVNGQPVDVRARGGTRFGPDNDLGVAFTANYSWDAFTTTLIQPDEWREINHPDFPAGVTVPEGTRLEQGRSEFTRFGATSNLEWHPTPDQQFGLVTSYAQTIDNQRDLQTEWNYSDDSFGEPDSVLFEPIPGVSPRERFRATIGRNDKESDLDRQEERMFFTIGSSEVRFGSANWTTRASYVRAGKDETIREWQFNNSLSEFDGDPSTTPFAQDGPYNFESIVRYDGAEVWGFPVNEKMYNDPSIYAFDGLGIDTKDATSESFEASSDVRYDVDWLGGANGFVKTGVRGQRTTTDLDAERVDVSPNPDNLLMLSDFQMTATPGSVQGLPIGPTVDPDRGKELRDEQPELFRSSKDQADSFLGDYGVDETIAAGYMMAGNEWGALRVLGGLRLESTTTEATVNSFNSTTGETAQRTEDNSYLDLFPNLHVRYQSSDRLQVRMSAAKTTARPNLSQIAGSENVGYDPGDEIQPGVVQQGNVSRGNPDLSPFRAWNLDATVEFYPSASDLYVANAFFKSIDDPIFTREAIQENVDAGGVTFQEAEVSRPVNANSGTIFGVETQLQQTLRFLPQPLDGLGIQANATVIESNLEIPGREGEDLPFFQQPDLITSVGPFFIWQGLDVRLNYSYTDDFVTRFAGAAPQDRFLDARETLDLKVTYDVTPNYAVQLSAENLTESPLRIYQGNESQTWQVQDKGRQFWFGLRAQF